jgi:hypothetical protein
MNRRTSITLIAHALVFSVVVLLVGNAPAQNGSGDWSNSFDPYTPIFTKAQVKTAETANARFTSALLANAVNYEPLLISPGTPTRAATQVHIGFWSGPGNHGSLVRVLDSINRPSFCSSTAASPNCAVWDEGATTSEQYPAYVKMLEEHWYDRGNAPAGARTVTLYGKTYRNINPLTFPQADQVWGQYSQRYADMARDFYRKTGNPVMVWCFVIGASGLRIFYVYEYPELQKLESEGVVKVYCANTPDADWQNPSDWTAGTGSASCPPPNSNAVLGAAPPEEPINVYDR